MKPFMRCTLVAGGVLLTLAQAGRAQGARATPSASPQQADSLAAFVGTYHLEVSFDGGTMPGVLTLATGANGLTGTLSVGEHSPPVRSVVVTGQRFRLTAGDGGFTVVYDVTVRGDSLTGSLFIDGQGGTVAGRRRR